MKVLVTGSTGFIGSQLCRALREEGHSVRAFHRPASNLRLLEGLDVEHVTGDLTQPETLLPAVQGMEVVFHTAAAMGHSGRRLGRMYTVTVEGTRALLQAALQAGVRRVVYTSSVAALGVPEFRMRRKPYLSLMTENHTWTPAARFWRYGYAKYLAELEVQRAVAQGLDAVILNPTLVFGAGDIHRISSSLVVQVARGSLPVMVQGGVNVVHIEDVVNGHLAAMHLGKRGERYILGGENLSMINLAEKIAAIAGVPPPVLLPIPLSRVLVFFLSLVPTFVRMPLTPELLRMVGYSFFYAIRKAQSVLQLPPPRPAEEALQDAYHWYVQMGAIEPKIQPAHSSNETAKKTSRHKS